MADVVKATGYICVENPLSLVAVTQYTVALFRRVATRSFWPEAIRVRVCLSFRDWHQSQQVEGLHGSIVHGRDS